MAGDQTDVAVETFLSRWAGPFLKRRTGRSLPDDMRLMGDLGVHPDTFYDIAEAFAERFCSHLEPPAPGPKGGVEICPPDLTVGEWKVIARSGRWPQDYWAVA